MSIITLTTDYGLKDHFVGSLKGKIISGYDKATIIDISHNIDPFNVLQAAYCISAAYKNFPKGSIHIIDVDSELTANTKHIAIQYNDQFFIAADNGILSALTQHKNIQKQVVVNIHDRLHENASDQDVFVAVACHIARGGLLNVVGKEFEELKKVSELTADIDKDGTLLKGNVIYIDHLGNCVTNISKSVFTNLVRGRDFEIKFKNRTKSITRIHKKYADFKNADKYPLNNFEGLALALFNENDLLEIALYKSNPKTAGSASSLLGLNYRDNIIIEFK